VKLFDLTLHLQRYIAGRARAALELLHSKCKLLFQQSPSSKFHPFSAVSQAGQFFEGRNYMKKLAIFVALTGLGLGLATGVQAQLLGDLCGTTVSVNTQVAGITETIVGVCTIRVADGVMLVIDEASITAVAGLTILGFGDAELQIHRSDIQLGDTFFITFEDGRVVFKKNDRSISGFEVEIVTNGGDIDVRENNFNIDGDVLFITRSGGDIDVRDNDFDFIEADLGIRSLGGGDVNVKKNSGDIEESLEFTFAGAGDINVKNNDFDVGGDVALEIHRFEGDIIFVNNNFGANE
jgi:hypothetical protein